MAYHTHGRLQIDTTLADFINSAALPSTNIESADFWDGFAHILAEFVPRNHALLEKRDQLQAQIDQYHQQYPKDTFADYKAFLQKIGYLVHAPQDFTISTKDVDPELATMAGPQLVVPINNARYALNAANARWGSLYDALYGTDVLSQENGAEKTSSYNPVRGKAVISQARQYLNDIAPLTHGSHTDAVRYTLTPTGLLVTLQDATQTRRAAPEQCIG